MAKVHERVLELAVTLNAAADTIQVTSAKYSRTRANVEDASGYALSYTPTTAQTSPAEIAFGELLPPPTHLRFTFANF
jgi:hypothetical protein